MADRFLNFINTPVGQRVGSLLGLPTPVKLKRMQAAYEQRALDGEGVLMGAAGQGEVPQAAVKAVSAMKAQVKVCADLAGVCAIKNAASLVNIPVSLSRFDSGYPERYCILDMSQASSIDDLRLLYEFYKPRLRAMPRHGRILILGRSQPGGDAVPVAVQGALSGFMRSLAKEVGKRGVTANLLLLEPKMAPFLEGAMRFFLSPASAFVTGQVLSMNVSPQGKGGFLFDFRPLRGQTAVVTGAARGIGAAISEVLAREGASVIGVDLPSDEARLGATMSEVDGQVCLLDITSENAGRALAEFAKAQQGGEIDIMVHNAGITRDRMLRNMPPEAWDQVLDVNLGAILRSNEQLLEQGFSSTARVVCVSSIGGLAGNVGQTNYAATKSALVNYVAALSDQLKGRGIAVNAVAPGFIETQMTAAVPALTRQVARRLCSLSQGGLPIDVAEAVVFLAGPWSAGISGATLRVCGQNLMGR